jgi:hypothetical protein
MLLVARCVRIDLSSRPVVKIRERLAYRTTAGAPE